MVKENKDINILIVDDTPQNVQLLGTILKQQNYSISVCSNGMKALTFLENKTPDLILLDVMMPELDGFETCKRIKNNPNLINIPIIFLTAKTEIEDVIKGLEYGAVDYITKPFNSTELLRRVKTHLELKFTREELDAKNIESKELLHVLCHDLNNPIGAVLNIIGIIENYEDFLELKKDMHDALKNSLQIIELVRKMRALEENKIALSISPISIHELLNDSISILKNKFLNKNINLFLNVNSDVYIYGEKVSLVNSVINNILTNAIKFSYPNSNLEIFSEEVESDKINIVFRDYGIGIPDSILPGLFTMAKSVSRKGTAGEQGTGFGMSLIRKFMEKYGGTIKIESWDKNIYPDSHGTKVILTFRRAPKTI